MRYMRQEELTKNDRQREEKKKGDFTNHNENKVTIVVNSSRYRARINSFLHIN